MTMSAFVAGRPKYLCNSSLSSPRAFVKAALCATCHVGMPATAVSTADSRLGGTKAGAFARKFPDSKAASSDRYLLSPAASSALPASQRDDAASVGLPSASPSRSCTYSLSAPQISRRSSSSSESSQTKSSNCSSALSTTCLIASAPVCIGSLSTFLKTPGLGINVSSATKCCSSFCLMQSTFKLSVGSRPRCFLMRSVSIAQGSPQSWPLIFARTTSRFRLCAPASSLGAPRLCIPGAGARGGSWHPQG
mmetsp:Transcript_404/g.1351  ORF Transcript_404/g.1351 Transcript_404/m.1351 type:complete len:250 (+) Transcript_404:282-1031(+)